MRIGIECSILTRTIAGIGYYAYNLIRELATLDGDEEYTLFYNQPLQPVRLSSRFRHSQFGPASTHLWVQTRLKSLCRNEKIDLLHSPGGQGLPLMYDGPRILTIHDLAPLLYPRHKDWFSRIIWTCIVPMMARQSSHIITVSENTKADVVDRLGIHPEQVTTIYEAAAPEYYPETDTEKLNNFRRHKALEPGYILAVGTLEPRKQYPFLFRVFARWLDVSKSNAVLVVIGKKGWLYDEIFRTIRQLNLQKHIRMEGYVESLDVMRLYYSAAQFSMLTPAYEGFWLPGLESLACGTPVIAPNHSSIPEVVGDAGILVDSWDEDEWITAMNRLWLATDRDRWSEKGIERAALFGWKKAAQETLKLYRTYQP